MKDLNEIRITKQQLMKLYGVDRTTIESWIKDYGLPMIQITSHSKYIREKDLIEWEDSMKKDCKFNGVLES